MLQEASVGKITDAQSVDTIWLVKIASHASPSMREVGVVALCIGESRDNFE